MLKNFETQLQNASREQVIEIAVMSYKLYLEQQQLISDMNLGSISNMK